MMNVEAIMRAIEAAAAQGLQRGAAVYQQAVQLSLNRKGAQPSKGINPSAPGQPPGNRQGHLHDSISIVPAGPLRFRVGTNLGYGRVLELGTSVALGGPIKPKRGKYLVIPLLPKASRAYTQYRSGGLRALMASDPSLKWFKSRSGKLFVVKTYKRKARELWFVLKESVSIAPRPFLSSTWRNVRDKVARETNRTMSQALPAMLKRELGVAR